MRADGVGAAPAPVVRPMKLLRALDREARGAGRSRDQREIGIEAVWSLSTAKSGNGVEQLRDNNVGPVVESARRERRCGGAVWRVGCCCARRSLLMRTPPSLSSPNPLALSRSPSPLFLSRLKCAPFLSFSSLTSISSRARCSADRLKRTGRATGSSRTSSTCSSRRRWR